MSALLRVAAVFAVALFITGAPPAFAHSHHHRHHGAHYVYSGYHPPSSYLLMDSDTGAILAQSNADLPLHPASLTKTMTLLLTFEALERGDLRLSDPVMISSHAASMMPSKLDLPVGSSISVQNAIYAIVTKSANDIAVALAEKLGGTEGRFAVLMNRRAQQLGMSRTRFTNASGLNNPAQVSTARDMALLARYLIRAHPQYYRYFAVRDFTYGGYAYHNHNHLMDTYAGMDGLKTGFIQQSGFNLISSAKRGGHRLIGVVFGGRSTNARNIEMAGLLNRGFAGVDHVTVASAARPAWAPPSKLAMADSSSAAQDEDEDPELQKGALGSMIGQGDTDPAVSSRFEAGLQAIAAIRQQGDDDREASLPAGQEAWAIQIGAGSSRSKVDSLLQNAQAALPPSLSKGSPVIVPLKTAQGWVFRGRLSGYSEPEAVAACKLLKDCIPVSPQAY
jgi:D-alanyl-D-alanine carboxypeptidase